MLACWFPFWAFYIHRNDLNAMLSFFFKQFLVLLVLGIVCVAVQDQLRRWLQPDPAPEPVSTPEADA